MSLTELSHKEDSQRHCSRKLEMKSQTNICILSEFRLVSGDAGNTGRSEGEKVFLRKVHPDIIYWNPLEPIEPIKLHKSQETEKSQKQQIFLDALASLKTMFKIK